MQTDILIMVSRQRHDSKTVVFRKENMRRFKSFRRETIFLGIKAQHLAITEKPEEADEVYNYEWALNPADVSKLQNV